jgi:hypothetical protein
VFDDPDGDHDWSISASIDLATSDDAGEPVVSDHDSSVERCGLTHA